MLSTEGPGGQGCAAAAEAAMARATEVAARMVSTTGAAFEAVHSGGGCTSGSGPFVKMSEQPGVVMVRSTARRVRGIEFTHASRRTVRARRLPTGGTAFLTSIRPRDAEP